VEADMLGFVPADREDVMVVYGPVRDRRKDYVLPLRNVSI
jgi:hypothetical protein